MSTMDLSTTTLTKIESILRSFNDTLENSLKVYRLLCEDNVLPFILSNNYGHYLLDSEEKVKRNLEANHWNQVFAISELSSVMPASEKDKWYNQIEKKEFPDFTKENIQSTFLGLFSKKDDFFADKITGLFRSLSSKHQTNNGIEFGEKFIITNVTDGNGFTNTRKIDLIHDLRDIMYQVKFTRSPSYGSSRDLVDLINNKDKYGTWFEVDGGLWRVKLFKNGSAHFEISEDMTVALNKCLSKKFPNIIGLKKESKRAKKKTANPILNSHHTEALLFIYNNLKSSEDGSFLKLSKTYRLDSLDTELKFMVLRHINSIQTNEDDCFFIFPLNTKEKILELLLGF